LAAFHVRQQRPSDDDLELLWCDATRDAVSVHELVTAYAGDPSVFEAAVVIEAASLLRVMDSIGLTMGRRIAGQDATEAAAEALFSSGDATKVVDGYLAFLQRREARFWVPRVVTQDERIVRYEIVLDALEIGVQLKAQVHALRTLLDRASAAMPGLFAERVQTIRSYLT
jgi:hypothetical protein